MKRIALLAIAVAFASFVVDCGNSAMTGTHGMPDAQASGSGSGGCCTVTAPTYTTIAEGDLSTTGSGSPQSPPIDVSQYREVIIGAASSTCDVRTISSPVFFVEPNSSTPVFTNSYAPGRITTNGPSMILSTYNCSALHYVVTGVGLN